MNQSRISASPHHASSLHGSCQATVRYAAAIAGLILLLALAVAAIGPWRAQPGAGAASVAPALQADLPSGPRGTTVLLGGQSFPREAGATTNSLTFESTSSPRISLTLPVPTITSCSTAAIAGFGFGVPCTSQPYAYQIPTGTLPGSYQFHFLSPASPAPNGGPPYLDVTAPFQVTAPATDTPTATASDTASPSASPTASVTNTAVPNAPTATNTPVAPTATNSPVPPTTTSTQVPPTATPTATATPKPFLVLVRPEFNRDRVTIALRAGRGVAIHMTFAIAASGHTVYTSSTDGKTDGRGFYSLNLKIAYPAHKPGQASLTIKETDAAGSKTIKRDYHYQFY